MIGPALSRINSVVISAWTVPPGTKPIHAGKKAWGTNFCASAWGACIHTRADTGNYYWGILFKICIRTFANMYSHLRPLPLYGYSGCIHTSLVPIHKNKSGELISGQIHVAHAFACGRIQKNIPGTLFVYWFRARGHSCGWLHLLPKCHCYLQLVVCMTFFLEGQHADSHETTKINLVISRGQYVFFSLFVS